MKRMDLVRSAAGAIIAHPMRSTLTSLGVVIGVAAVVIMTSIGLGAQQRVMGAISGLGSNLIIISPAASRSGFVAQAAGTDISISGADADALAKQLDGVVAVAPKAPIGTAALRV
jgi:putative ABC transport system permease protein